MVDTDGLDQSMPTGKFYLNGMTMGMGGNPNPSGGKRGTVDGWSKSAVRRHTRWLYAVDSDNLTGSGFALTLTIRDCPETDAEWGKLRDKYFALLRATGRVLRTHWVVEWTRRKVPHIHMAVYLDGDVSEADAIDLLILPWIRLALPFGTSVRAQHLAPITGALGWLEYLSKHAARGVTHYQRAGKPSGWEKTGRLWGHTGDWPTVEPAEAMLNREDFFRFRRLVRSWRVADARASALAGKSSWKRVTSARTMLSCPDRVKSEVRGVSEWIPEKVGLDLLSLTQESTRPFIR